METWEFRSTILFKILGSGVVSREHVLDFEMKDLLKQLLPCSSIIMKGAWSTVTTLYTVVALNPDMEFIIPGEYMILLPHSQLPISFLYNSRSQNQGRKQGEDPPPLHNIKKIASL